MKVNWIVVHTAAADIPGVDARTINSWHRQRGFAGIGYHFVVCDDGLIEAGRDENKIGSHARGLNAESIGVCVTGHGDVRDFAPEQYASLIPLLTWLCVRYDLAAGQVIGHREINERAGAPDPGKTCPGKCVDMNVIRDEVRKNLAWAAGGNTVGCSIKPRRGW